MPILSIQLIEHSIHLELSQVLLQEADQTSEVLLTKWIALAEFIENVLSREGGLVQDRSQLFQNLGGVDSCELLDEFMVVDAPVVVGIYVTELFQVI